MSSREDNENGKGERRAGGREKRKGELGGREKIGKREQRWREWEIEGEQRWSEWEIDGEQWYGGRGKESKDEGKEKNKCVVLGDGETDVGSEEREKSQRDDGNSVDMK